MRLSTDWRTHPSSKLAESSIVSREVDFAQQLIEIGVVSNLTAIVGKNVVHLMDTRT